MWSWWMKITKTTMAQSPSSSTSENPPIQNLGLGDLSIPKTTPSDPISTDQIAQFHHSQSPENAPDGDTVEVVDENSAIAEEVEFCNANERELSQFINEIERLEAAIAKEVEFRNANKRELSQFTIEQAQIERLEAAIAEKVEFRNAIERELSQLTIEQAQIERLEATFGDDDDDDDDEASSTDVVTVVKADNLDDGGKDEESVEDENEDHDENVEVKLGEGAMNVARYNSQSNYRRRINSPMRPDAEDCDCYMKFGSCKFGVNCKFNHPVRRNNQGFVKEISDHRQDNSQRAGQTECKYYLTSGGCKNGNNCKFSHGSDKNYTSQISKLNFLGLPIRPGEKECSYYMRTGACKYGPSCRFHHPDPTTVNGGVDSSSGNGNLVSSSPVSSRSPPRAFNESSPFVPVMFRPTQGASASNTEWNGYQAEAYPASERRSPTTRPAFAINNLSPEINFSMPHQHDLVVEEYPERPGEPECSFFIKTGDRKFKSNCKFHHPKNHISRPKLNTSALNDKGLPLRPDEPICKRYKRHGSCKYGPACKYDHPSQFAILPPPFDRPPIGNLNIVVDGAETLRRGNRN